MSIRINRDGTVEAWDGDNYVPMGSMRVDSARPIGDTELEPLDLYIVIEEYPAFTIYEFHRLAKDQRQQGSRKRRLRELLQEAVELAARRASESQP